MTHTDTTSADTNITGTTTGQLHTLSRPLLTHSPLWRAYRTHANGCGRLRTVADTDTTFREHSLTPTPPHETGTLATHSGKCKKEHVTVNLGVAFKILQTEIENLTTEIQNAADISHNRSVFLVTLAEVKRAAAALSLNTKNCWEHCAWRVQLQCFGIMPC